MTFSVKCATIKQSEMRAFRDGDVLGRLALFMQAEKRKERSTMAKVLLCNVTGEKRTRVKVLLMRLGIACREVTPAEFGKTVSALTGKAETMEETAPETETMAEPAPETETLGESAPETETMAEPAPAAETMTDPAPEKETMAEPAPEKETMEESAYEAAASAPAVSFSDEMLVMDGLSATQFHGLLDGLRASRAGIVLKAVVTEQNRSWTVSKLHAALREEHERLSQNKTQR